MLKKKVHIGPQGGKYIMRHGKKKYILKNNQRFGVLSEDFEKWVQVFRQRAAAAAAGERADPRVYDTITHKDLIEMIGELFLTLEQKDSSAEDTYKATQDFLNAQLSDRISREIKGTVTAELSAISAKVDELELIMGRLSAKVEKLERLAERRVQLRASLSPNDTLLTLGVPSGRRNKQQIKYPVGDGRDAYFFLPDGVLAGQHIDVTVPGVPAGVPSGRESPEAFHQRARIAYLEDELRKARETEQRRIGEGHPHEASRDALRRVVALARAPARLDVTRAERQSSASHPRQPF